MNRFCLVILLLLATISNADAKNCKTGKPCGNSCIKMNDVCHVEEASSYSSSSSRSSSPAISYSYSEKPQVMYKCNGILVTEREYKNCNSAQHASDERKESAEADDNKKKEIHSAKTETIRVDKILDADIFQCAGKKERKIKLYGIDAPEDGQPFYQEAKSFLEKLIRKKKVTAKIYSKDDDGTYSAVIFVNKKNVNKLMIESGYAWVHEELCTESFCDDWIKIEEEVKSEEKGLWSDHGRLPPWVWR